MYSFKISPVAKYLAKNNVKAYKPHYAPNTVEFVNTDGKILGRLKKEKDNDLTRIKIDLYKENEDKPFLQQLTIVQKLQRYFLDKHRFIPVRIQINKYINDSEHNIHKQDELTRGLSSDLYIDQIKECDELVKERQIAGLPENYPIFKINKPFKYEFKAHLHTPERPIDKTKPMIKG